MKTISLFSTTCSLSFLFSLFLGAPWTAVSFAEDRVPQGVEQTTTDDARQTFGRLEGYLKNNALQFTTSYDAQNVSLGTSRGSARFFIERPNLLRVEFSGSGFDYLMTSDGKTLTIYDQIRKKYAQRPATETPLAAMNLFTGLAALQARVLQFLGVVTDIASGDSDLQVKKAGVERIGGLNCVRYDIRYTSGEDTDQWAAWLRADGEPLPCKSFVRSPDEGSQQTNLYNWEDKISRSEKFNFAPPSGSKKVDISDLDLRPLQ
jgi:hypothetical protein